MLCNVKPVFDHVEGPLKLLAVTDLLYLYVIIYILNIYCRYLQQRGICQRGYRWVCPWIVGRFSHVSSNKSCYLVDMVGKPANGDRGDVLMMSFLPCVSKLCRDTSIRPFLLCMRYFFLTVFCLLHS
uniref:Uncharacterized protein n=1 Tax=Scophthalmus maximus TaxID=52904 RepID=A0A8D2ZH79_SCOMX